MRFRSFLVLVCISFAFSLPPIQWFNNLVDHFDPLNNETYGQRFSVDVPSGWQSGDPIFIFLAGAYNYPKYRTY